MHLVSKVFTKHLLVLAAECFAATENTVMMKTDNTLHGFYILIGIWTIKTWSNKEVLPATCQTAKYLGDIQMITNGNIWILKIKCTVCVICSFGILQYNLYLPYPPNGRLSTLMTLVNNLLVSLPFTLWQEFRATPPIKRWSLFFPIFESGLNLWLALVNWIQWKCQCASLESRPKKQCVPQFSSLHSMLG